MRYLILSDVHGNLEALEAVLAAAEELGWGHLLLLGDLVGYGASPNRVVERIRGLDRPLTVVRGNHDRAAAGLEPLHHFNPMAAEAARWTAGELEPEHRAFLEELPAGPLRVGEELAICHGSPGDEDAYILSPLDAREAFEASAARLTLFGHSHVACVFSLGPDGVWAGLLEGGEGIIEVEPDRRYLINPGSVGQPRDRDPRAALMVYDGEERRFHWRRESYDLERAQEKIVAAGLPRPLAERLARGA